MTNTPEYITNEEHQEKPVATNRGNGLLIKALLVVLVFAALCGAGVLVWINVSSQMRAQQQVEAPTSEQVAESPEGKLSEQDAQLPENPVDFAALKEQNPEVVAWIYVPGTNVNMPVAQSNTDDGFYLSHNLDGAFDMNGSAFIEMQNASTFTDSVTMVYGHNSPNGAMFSTLLNFENVDFFNEHDTMYVYTPGHVLIYRIVSAYLYDNRHVLNSFDFSNEQILRSYLDSVVAPVSIQANVREGESVPDGSRIVQLSTCPDGTLSQSARYLVTGVLIDDQITIQ